VSTTRKLVIASVIGALLALIHYGWMRYQAATIVVPISGQVMLNGRPVSNAYVKFSPIPLAGQNPLDTNPGSHAITDGAGNFTLLQIENDQPGVVVGEHKILMRTGRPGPGPEGYVDERIPFSWRKGVHTYHVSWSGRQRPVFRMETIDKYSHKAQSGNLNSVNSAPVQASAPLKTQQ
jgi:hypothetical protein